MRELDLGLSGPERTKLEEDLVVNDALSDDLLASVLQAHDSMDYEACGFAREAYHETRSHIRRIEQQLYPWLKGETPKHYLDRVLLDSSLSETPAISPPSAETTAGANPVLRLEMLFDNELFRTI